MRTLVTGASGHLGSYLAKRLLREQWDVTALVRPESDLWRLEGALDRIRVVRADLADVSKAAPAIAQARPEVVFHLAWQGVTSAFRNDPQQFEANVTGSLDLFAIVRAAGCQTWVGVGSQAEYGRQSGVLSEEMPLQPATAYGAAKVSIGSQIQTLSANAGIRYLWLRLLATYGPMDDERHVIPAVIRQLLMGESPRLTPGEQQWDYLFVEDAADALYRSAIAPEARGVYNLGSGESHSVRAILEHVRDLIDPALPLRFGELPYSPDQIMALQTSIDRLRRATGWSPATSLETGLARTVDWYKAHYEGVHEGIAHRPRAAGSSGTR